MNMFHKYDKLAKQGESQVIDREEKAQEQRQDLKEEETKAFKNGEEDGLKGIAKAGSSGTKRNDSSKTGEAPKVVKQTVATPPGTPQQQPTAPTQMITVFRTPDGKLQVKGLLPGQTVYQTADGR